MARRPSDERISVGTKWARANVLLPLAAMPTRRISASAGTEIVRATDRPPRSSAAGEESIERTSALCVAVRAHLRLGDRRLRLADGAGQCASADGRARLADEMNLREMAIGQPPGHITTLASGGRGHRAGLRLRKSILPEIASFHKSPSDLAA